MILITSCISQLEEALDDYEPQLLIDGGITNLPGPYEVRLNYTSTVLLSNDRRRIPVENASLAIETKSGQLYDLTQVRAGVYRTDSADFTGQIGESYRLNISLSDNRSYVSRFEELLSPTEMSGDRVVYEKGFLIGETNRFLKKRFQQHRVNVSIENEQDTTKYYKVEVSGYHNRRPIPIDECFPPEVTAFYYGTTSEGEITTFCWQQLGNVANGTRLFTNDQFASSSFEIEAITIPFDSRGTYIATVYLKRISNIEYEFWRALELQDNFSKDIFNPPFPQAIGNVLSTTDPNELVAGYFSVQGVSIRNVCIDRELEKADIAIPAQVLLCGENCLTVYPNSSWDPPAEVAACN